MIGQINDPWGPNPTLFRRDIDNSTLVDHILFDHYQKGRYLQLQKTSGRFVIAEIEMTFANMCKYDCMKMKGTIASLSQLTFQTL